MRHLIDHRLCGWLLASLLIAGALAGAVLPGVALAEGDDPSATGETEDSRVYIVQLRTPPAIDAAATGRRARPGRFDPQAAGIAGYGAALTASHDELLAAIGAPADAKLYSYRLAFNGFAAKLTAEQAARLRVHPAVQRVSVDRIKSLKTNASGQFLGLLDPAGGLRSARGLSGEGVVIGIIDSGIDPRYEGFSDRREKPVPRLCRGSWARESLLGAWLCHRFRKPRHQLLYTPLRGWRGRCETGPGFAEDACNNKLVGARFYDSGFRAMYRLDPGESLSPLDADGHGTHIASIAAGGRVEASIGGTKLAAVTGMAPRARIAVYKACWLQPDATRANCATSDLQRAIEDAIADGVDIINYSVGTDDGGPGDPDALALLLASDAGILPVAAAGNSGPGAASIDSPASAPWVLAVAASSRSGTRFDEVLRVTAPAAAAGNMNFKEAAFTPALRGTGAVEGTLAAAGLACASLPDADRFSGRIALVQRGACDFEAKLRHAEDAGAIAVVVYNTTEDEGLPITMKGTRGSVRIPAVMVGQHDGEALAARLEAGEAVRLRLEKGAIARRQATGNVLYASSARGPNPNVFAILKPDVAAPGVDILGAQTPEVANGVRGESHQYLSGTSMAAPHVAGVAALLKQAHPEWSPAALRSALMTTARQDLYREDGTSPADSFDVGAGHIVPDRAIEPGLVYEADRTDYEAFGCGIGLPQLDEERCLALSMEGYPFAPEALNLPSITSLDVIRPRSIQRRVTNVGPAAVFHATLSAPPGITASVEPGSLALAEGESAEYTVTFSSNGDARRLDYFDPEAALPDFRFGSLSWDSTQHSVRSPLAVAPSAIAVQPSVAGHDASGTTSIDIEFGYDGAYQARLSGLAAPTSYTGTVIDDPLKYYTLITDDAALPDFIRRHRISVPPGTRYLRVALAATDADHDDDLDLYLQCPDGSCPGGVRALASASDAETEVIDLLNPTPGEYLVDIHGFLVDDPPGGTGAGYELGVWMVDDASDAGRLEVLATPVTAATGAEGQLGLGWSDLDPGELYLGLVTHGDGEHQLAWTLVEIATP